MKKIFIIISLLMILLSLIVCGNSSAISNDSLNNKNRILIAYFSHSGNTTKLANQIHKIVGGDIKEIKTINLYPENFDVLVKQARKEREVSYKPPIHLIENIENYDTIYLGFPIWGNTIPPAISSFLSKYNLSGKTIIPFCTHDGYGKGDSFNAISEHSPNSIIFDVFDIVGKNIENEEETINRWIYSIDYNIISNNTNENETPIIITIGDKKILGTLNNNQTTKEFIKTLPQTIDMIRYGNREYYGPSPEKLFSEGDLKKIFENGELTYCPTNNTVAIFFAQTNQPNLTMPIISIGKVYSDLEVFDNMDNFIKAEITIKK